jgi:hypothetical protein
MTPHREGGFRLTLPPQPRDQCHGPRKGRARKDGGV